MATSTTRTFESGYAAIVLNASSSRFCVVEGFAAGTTLQLAQKTSGRKVRRRRKGFRSRTASKTRFGFMGNSVGVMAGAHFEHPARTAGPRVSDSSDIRAYA